jgi:adenylate cyclase
MGILAAALAEAAREMAAVQGVEFEESEPIGEPTRLDARQAPFTLNARPEGREGRPQLRSLSALSQALAATTSAGELLEVLAVQLHLALPNATSGAVLVRDAQGNLLLKAHWPPGRPSVSITWAAKAVAERSAFWWRSTDVGEIPVSLMEAGERSTVYAPLLWEDEVLGVICASDSQSPEGFGFDDIELFRAVANQAAAQLKAHALHDEIERVSVIRANLMRQFSPTVAERLLKQGGRVRLGGDRVSPVTILLSDIRGFTALSEQMDPGDVVQMLNEMFIRFVPIIFAHDGTVDKFIGDSVMAVFGSPEPDSEQCEKAIRAALDMQHAMSELQLRWHERGLAGCEVGVGIHTGPALHGFIGSPERMEYTVIGATVNRASRFCDAAEPGEVLISKEVYEHTFRLVAVEPRAISTKHLGNDPRLEGYLVTGLRSAAGPGR